MSMEAPADTRLYHNGGQPGWMDGMVTPEMGMWPGADMGFMGPAIDPMAFAVGGGLDYMGNYYGRGFLPNGMMDPAAAAAAGMLGGNGLDWMLGQFPCVRMRGIPYEAKMADVLAFFREGAESQGLAPPAIVDVVMPISPDGRATGDACVLFSNIMDTQAALGRDRQLMGRRYIEVFQATRDCYYKTVRRMLLAQAGQAGDAKGRKKAQKPVSDEDLKELEALLDGLSDKRPVLVDSEGSLKAMLEDLEGESTLAVDCEGVNLSRSGQLTLLQIAKRGGAAYAVDVLALGAAAFGEDPNPTPEGPKATGGSLRELLEDGGVTKLFFDPRCDADALLHAHGIRLRNVLCLQAAELAHRRQRGLNARLLAPMSRAVEEHCGLDAAQLRTFQLIKAAGKRLIRGPGEVWAKRPMPRELLHYAAFDVSYLFDMHDAIVPNLEPEWRDKVDAESDRRAEFYTEEDPQYEKMAEAPQW